MNTTATRRSPAVQRGPTPVASPASTQEPRPELPSPQYRRLPRHGKPDLLFTGILLGTAHEPAPPEDTRRNWWEIALYKTSVGAYLLASTYHVVEEGDRSLSTVISFAEAACLRDFFDTHGSYVSQGSQHSQRSTDAPDSPDAPVSPDTPDTPGPTGSTDPTGSPISELARSLLLQAMAKDRSLRAAFVGFVLS